jgi:hypothetical protein
MKDTDAGTRSLIEEAKKVLEEFEQKTKQKEELAESSKDNAGCIKGWRQ